MQILVLQFATRWHFFKHTFVFFHSFVIADYMIRNRLREFQIDLRARTKYNAPLDAIGHWSTESFFTLNIDVVFLVLRDLSLDLRDRFETRL